MHRRGVLAVALAVVVVGCGEGATTTAPLTAAQLRTRADAICARLNARTIRAFEAADNNGGPDQSPAERRAYARLIATTTGYLREAAVALEALDPPAAMRATFSRLTQALRGVAAGFPTTAETMAERDPRAAQRDEQRRNVTALAQELDLRVCG